MTTVTKKKPVFKKISRFDPISAAKGVAHTITDEWDNTYPVWTTSLFDVHNKFLKVASDKFKREHANDPLNKGDKADLYAFVCVCVHGWSGMLDADDKEIPFDKGTAFDYLCDDDNSYFTAELLIKSQDVRNYPMSPAATKVEDAGK